MNDSPYEVSVMDCIHHGKTEHFGGGYNTAYWPMYKYTSSLHRIVYCQHHGLSPDDIKGKVVMHLCDNPWCININHLKLGTYKENSQDMVKKGRHNRKRKIANPAKELYKEWENVDINDYVK